MPTLSVSSSNGGPIIGFAAPWWRDLNKAKADEKVTKAEVQKLIAPHKDLFDDKNYRTAPNALTGGTRWRAPTATSRRRQWSAAPRRS